MTGFFSFSYITFFNIWLQIYPFVWLIDQASLPLWNNGNSNTRIFDKRDFFNFRIMNYPHLINYEIQYLFIILWAIYQIHLRIGYTFLKLIQYSKATHKNYNRKVSGSVTKKNQVYFINNLRRSWVIIFLFRSVVLNLTYLCIFAFRNCVFEFETFEFLEHALVYIHEKVDYLYVIAEGS